jgi:Zn finger protein HypA/HybF involved in hydrogenase expression
MARFRCRACGEEGTFVYDGRRDCPQCGSVDVQLAIGVEELTDDHPLIEAMERLAEQHVAEDGDEHETGD